MKVSSSSSFYRFGAACCLYYIAAQLVQQITLHLGLNDCATGEAGILQQATSLDQFRLVLILLSFTLIPITAAYAGVAVRRHSHRPGASLLGFAFSVLFAGSEATIRSIDLFLVSRQWAVEYRVAASESVRQGIAARIQVWGRCGGRLLFRVARGTHAFVDLLRFRHLGQRQVG